MDSQLCKLALSNAACHHFCFRHLGEKALICSREGFEEISKTSEVKPISVLNNCQADDRSSQKVDGNGISRGIMVDINPTMVKM